MSAPTTEDVRDAYQSTGEGLDFMRVWHERGAQFDAWLAEHDRTLAARPAVDVEEIASAIGEIHGCKNAVERPCALCHNQSQAVVAYLAGEGRG